MGNIVVVEADSHTVVVEQPSHPIVVESLSVGPQGPRGLMGKPDVITQAEYDLLDPKDPAKVYYIVG